MYYWLKDFKSAFFSLIKRPGYMAVVILTLSVTLSAFLTMFTLNYTVLMKPLPYPQQQQLFIAQGERYDTGKLLGAGVHSYAGAEQVYKKNDVFEKTFLIHYEEQLINDIGNQPKLFTAYTTPEYFSILAPKMAMGRYFSEDEGLNSRKAVAVISYEAWQENYAGKADILDHKVQIDDVSYSIVGVLGNEFVEPAIYQPGRQTRIWMPFDFNSRDEETRQNWTTGFYELKIGGLLKEGTRELEANQYLTTMMNDRYVQEVRSFSWGKNASVGVTIRSFEVIIVGDSRKTSLMLLAGVFALLLIACANITNIFLSRAAEKQRQYAIQATLGAQKFHMFRAIFTELFILTFLSSAIALILTQLSFGLLQNHGQEHLARLDELALNPLILIFSLLLSIFLAAIFAVMISNLIDYRALNSLLRVSGKGSGLQISKRTRNILIASQVGLATVLLSVNFTLLTSSMQVIGQSPGFKTQGLIWVSLDSGAAQYNRQERIAYIDTIMNRLEQLPEVHSVSNTIYPPLITDSWTSILTENLADTGNRVLPNVNLVDENFLPMFDMRLVAGRNVKAQEIQDSEKVLLINETIAKAFGGTEQALGKNLYWDGREDPYKVVGVLRDVFIPRKENVAMMYTGRTSSLSFMIRLNNEQTLSKSSLNSTFRQINRNLRIGHYSEVDGAYKELLARDISIAVITMGLSALTLLLAGLGIYGVLSYSINLRTYELGVRMALGGSPKILSKLVLGESSKPVAIGFIVSLVTLGLIYMMLVYKYDLQVIVDYWSLVLSVVTISSLSFIACFVPLRKVVFSKPIDALK